MDQDTNMNLSERISEYLKQNAGIKFSARELAEWFFQTFPEICNLKRLNSQQNLSNDTKLISQIASEIGSCIPSLQKRDIEFTADTPRRFYFPEKSERQSEEQIEKLEQEIEKIQEQDNELSEHDLYPKLNEFLWRELKIYPKRIDEKTSNSGGKNAHQWLHPDIVALEDLRENWKPIIRSCAEKTSAQMIKLWSFEVKTRLNSGNVRKSFFQAVSNSSWANYGYLVAAEIHSNILPELKILCKLHSIGIITLNTEDPIESQILIPAEENYAIDWDGANRICAVNSDFKKFIEQVHDAFQTKIRLKEWDIPEDYEED